MKALTPGALVERLNIALDKESRETLNRLAAGKRMSVSAYLRWLLAEEEKRERRRKS